MPGDSCFVHVVTALQYEVKVKCLATKVRKWFDETQGKQVLFHQEGIKVILPSFHEAHKGFEQGGRQQETKTDSVDISFYWDQTERLLFNI